MEPKIGVEPTTYSLRMRYLKSAFVDNQQLTANLSEHKRTFVLIFGHFGHLIGLI